MFRLVSEISLSESDANDFDLNWNPNDLNDTKNKLRLYEEIVDDQLVLDDTFPDQTPLSEAQVQSIFYPDVSNSSPSVSNRLYTGDVSRRSFGIGREQRVKDVVSTISHNLRWYQNKIVQEIESTNEYKTLANLLDLNDRVSNVLSKANYLTNNEVNSSNQSSSVSHMNNGQPISILKYSTSLLANSSEQIAHSIVSSQSNQQEDVISSPLQYPTVVSALYALRRGGGREDTLTVVENLIKLGNFESEVHLPAVKQMMATGALQLLLSTLSRAGEWPEVEIQISKVISVLVTYEDDWSLLQRSAIEILSSLYTLQLKDQYRLKANAPQDSPAPTSSSGDTIESNPATNQDSLNQQNQDIRALIAAAIVKLSLVLSSEWEKQSNPFKFDYFSNASSFSAFDVMSLVSFHDMYTITYTLYHAID